MKIDRHRIGPFEIAFRITGAGFPLLMFHGAEGDHQIYDKLQDALGSSVTAISFDQRDCGLSEYPSAEPYTLKDVAHDAVRLIDTFGHESVDVLGNSIGGILAQLMAYYWPERVRRLVLGLTWPADERLTDLNPEGIARRIQYSQMGEAGQLLIAELMSSPDYVAAHPEILTDLRSLKTEPKPDAYQRRRAAFAVPIDIDPGRIHHETLIIAGEVDQMVPAAVTQRLVTRLPNTKFELLPNAGHLAARQFPNELASLIRSFLCRPCS
ncbi:alpha/beta fold hydrolase [Bradyrhizobium sp. Pha-3]|uniref:alpha/beta fold hydrolase n=1 Tax=Bradyrhizobium sp. Pha-3 TaxID=208375 RepID=UPI0035D50130